MKIDNGVAEIYWSPYFDAGLIDWSMIYQGEISTLYDEMRKEMCQDEEPHKNLFYCPSVRNLTSNIAVLKNTLKSQFKIEDGKLLHVSYSHVGSNIPRKPSMEGRQHIEYGLAWIFFSEENIEMTLSSPYFDTPNHMKYGNIVPGKLNISTWFRKINPEFVLKKGINEFEIDAGEDIAYLTFNTSKKLKFTRFELSNKLRTYAMACSSSSDWERWVDLEHRYERFDKSQMTKLVLNEIKKNLID
jgi:hypothetical protein